jgi:23S rRNA pseudouridine2604 synthase
MNIDLKGLPVGEWRDLTERELKVIYSLLERSSGVDEKKSKLKQPTKKGKPEMLKTSGSKKSKQGHSSSFNRTAKGKLGLRSGRS